MKVIKVKEIPLSLARDLLSARQKSIPLEPYQASALSHASKFSKLPPDKSEKLVEELTSEFKLSRATAVQVANIVPSTPQELRVLLAKESRVFLPEDLEKVLEVVKKYTG
ncbi:MAG: RNA polymerase Rpb4 family protein [Candidatus Nezhaarchaeota archaeon]|nr:RNA polymerase Rpb4 family protein [Candidatus Nezhaarchaeota archaeon]